MVEGVLVEDVGLGGAEGVVLCKGAANDSLYDGLGDSS